MNQAHQVIFQSFRNPDPASFGVYKMIDSIYPAFAKKIFEGNKLMYNLVMSGYNPMHILDYPICNHCESIAAYHGLGVKDGRRVRRCKCFKCGNTSLAPVTLREWMSEELKKRAPQKVIESIDDAVDQIAAVMVRNFYKNCADVLDNQRAIDRRKMGLVDSFGNPITTEEKHEVTLEVTNRKVDLEEEARRLGEEDGLDVEEA